MVGGVFAQGIGNLLNFLGAEGAVRQDDLLDVHRNRLIH